MQQQTTTAFLLGVIATLLAVLVFSPRVPGVTADTTGNGGFVGITGSADPGGKNILWLVDSTAENPHLCLYEWENGRLLLQSSRAIKYDFMMDQFPGTAGSHKPSVQEVYEMTEAQRKKGRK